MSGFVLGRDAERDLDNLWDFVAGESVEATGLQKVIAAKMGFSSSFYL
jgi:hypothetical protein